VDFKKGMTAGNISTGADGLTERRAAASGT
jgi:hypothetical protein